MPPKQQATEQPPRRSGRRAVIDENELSVEAAAAQLHPANAHEPGEAAADNAERDDGSDDDDTVMQEPDAGGVTVEPASRQPPATVQPPIQRLTSVLPPSSSSSAASMRPQAPTSTSADSEQQPRPSALKFKPKAIIRRSKEEREAFEKAERERLAARHHAFDGSAVERGTGRDRGRGRGRGGYYDGRAGRGSVAGAFSSHGYGRGFGGSRGGDALNSTRRERMDSRVASGPLGGAAVAVANKRGRRTGTGVEEVSGADGEDSGDEVIETGGTVKKGKGKGKERVKKEGGVKPEGGDMGTGMEAGKKGKRKRGSATAVAGAGVAKGKGRAKVKKEDDAPTYISSEGEFDSDTAEKINIEAINLVSSEDEEDEEGDTELPLLSAMASGKQKEMEILNAVEAKKVKNWMNRPVHVERLEHVERAVGVNTDASSLSSADLRRKAKERKEGEGGLFVDEADPEMSSGWKRGRRKPKDVEFLRDKRKWKGVYVDEDDDEGQNGGGVRIKSEPVEDMTTADAQLVLEKDDEVPGAETRETDDVDVDAAVHETTAAAGARDNVEGARALDKEVDINEEALTDEEDADYEDLDLEMVTEDEEEDDLDLEIRQTGLEEDESYNLSKCQPEWQNLLEQYAKSRPAEPATATDLKPTPKSAFSGNSEESKATRHHKTYLVQLPPVIPSLRDVIAKPRAVNKEKKPKSEPIAASTNPFNVLHPKDMTKEETSPPPPTSTDHQKIPNAVHQPAHASDFAGGVAGTLTFYCSGRALASWGDLSFEVTKERETVGSAQETVMMDYAKVVTKIEDHGRWEDVVTVGGQKEREGGKVGYSGGRVGGGFCMLGA